jgi:hypothetical protein
LGDIDWSKHEIRVADLQYNGKLVVNDKCWADYSLESKEWSASMLGVSVFIEN